MAKKGRRQAAVTSKTLVLNGGLNYAQSVANIADNELSRAANMIYDPDTDQLMARPGTNCVTAEALGYSIQIGYFYVKDSTTSFHIAASNGKLYYLVGDAYVEIGSLNDTTTVPSFVTFNSKLIIADGGTHLHTWAGTGGLSELATSPAADALAVIKNRLVANHVSEDDSVYLSKTNDETDWNTAGSAVGLKAGFGDLLRVNAFGVYGDDLIISKVGEASKRMYRLNVADPSTTSWYVASLSFNNAASSATTMVGAWNNVYFVDTDGFKTLKGVTEYGDLQIDRIGSKVNPIFTSTSTCNYVSYVPTYNSVWFNVLDRVFCYTERYNSAQNSIIANSTQKNVAFTDLFFKWGRPTSVYEADDVVYITGLNGHLYQLDETVATDETSPGVRVNYTCGVKTKTFSYFDDIILRKIQWYLRPKKAGTGVINLCWSENDKVQLKNFTILGSGELLYSATEYLNDATGYLYEVGASAWTEETRNRYRGTDIAFEIEITSGRCGVEWCKFELAELEGGE